MPSSKFAMLSQYLLNPSQRSVARQYNLQRCLRFKENQCGNQKMVFLNAPIAVLLSRESFANIAARTLRLMTTPKLSSSIISTDPQTTIPQITSGRTLVGRVLGIFWRASLLCGTNCNGHCLPFHVRAFGPWLGG